MMTVESLKAYGANTDEGMNRCFNNEGFYLRLVGMGLADGNFDKLREAVEQGNPTAAFEAAHALKGAIGNLSLTPIYVPICEITEKLRGQSTMPPVDDLLREILTQRDKALALND